LAAQESDVVIRLAGALVPFWEGGHVAEGRQRVASALSATRSETLGRAKLLSGAALLARQSGDAAEARTRAAESRALYRELGDMAGAANATLILGLALADDGGDFVGAMELFEEGARLFGDIGDESNALWAARLLAWMCEELGDFGRAQVLHETNLDRARALGNRQLEGQTLAGLAWLAIEQGRAGDAVSFLKEVLRIDRDLGARFQTSLDLTRFGRALAFAGGGDVEAAKLLSCAEAVREEMGGGGMPYLVRNHEEALEIVRTRMRDDAFAEAWEAGARLTTDEAVEIALTSLD
jgi:tetratricopeptide (TPR) repeat protein